MQAEGHQLDAIDILQQAKGGFSFQNAARYVFSVLSLCSYRDQPL